MTTYVIPDDLLSRLIDIGKQEAFHELRQRLKPEEKLFHKQMMIQPWQFWYPIAERLTQNDLKALIKTLTMAESLLDGWQGGSVSTVIWLFNKYTSTDKNELTDWILCHTDNGYVPFSNYGAKSLDDYHKFRYENSAEGRRAAKAIKNIFVAIASGDVNGVKALIQKGADLAACNSDGLTPLQWAEKCAKDDIVNILNIPNNAIETDRE